MSGERFLVDTNILVYAYDRTEYTKQGRSRQILDWLYRKGLGALSTQVLGEFFSAVTRRLTEKMPGAGRIRHHQGLCQFVESSPHDGGDYP